MSELIKSWVKSANEPNSQFPLNNLPYGVFDDGNGIRCGVAIGDKILDLKKIGDMQSIQSVPKKFFEDKNNWNPFMELGQKVWSKFRKEITRILSEESQGHEEWLVEQKNAKMLMPFSVTEFTDFYAGRHHATNVGTMFRGAENALPPNWLHIPIGYNGRASSVVISQTDIQRPWGQLKAPDADMPQFQPCRRFDLELEMGAIVGKNCNEPLSVKDADEAIFGYVLLNDWSARDIQAWEYQPLGPFQAKATATSISPWIVTKEALEPFRVDTPMREFELLDYLKDNGPMLYDIELEVDLIPNGAKKTTIAKTNYKEMYYSAAQQLAHHSSSGCPMRIGDLLGSGTISGEDKNARGSMLEISWGGKEPITIGEHTRSFLEDGDEVILRGTAKGNGYNIGFGKCSGAIIPARMPTQKIK